MFNRGPDLFDSRRAATAAAAAAAIAIAIHTEPSRTPPVVAYTSYAAAALLLAARALEPRPLMARAALFPAAALFAEVSPKVFVGFVLASIH